MFRQRKAQGTLEFLAMTTIILAVFLTMGHYLKRGVQGRWKSAVDEFGEQYDPRTTNSSVRQLLEANTITIVTTVPDNINGINGIWTMRTDQSNSLETRSGGTTVGAF
jgi:hypothetical protein